MVKKDEDRKEEQPMSWILSFENLVSTHSAQSISELIQGEIW